MNPMNIPPGVRSYSGGQWHTRLKLGLRKAPTLRSSVHGGHWSVGLMILKIVELNSGGWLQTFFSFFRPVRFCWEIKEPNWQVTSFQAESNQVGIGKLVNSDSYFRRREPSSSSCFVQQKRSLPEFSFRQVQWTAPSSNTSNEHYLTSEARMTLHKSDTVQLVGKLSINSAWGSSSIMIC